jgi:hypothetical protein
VGLISNDNSKFSAQSFLPALIFALCILEMSFGALIKFHVVWWFYFYVFWSLLNSYKANRNLINSFKLDRRLLWLYAFNTLFYLGHHLLGKELYEHSTNEAFNILWWTTFGILVVWQIQVGVISLLKFQKYLILLTFIGSVLAAFLGLIKYVNILSGSVSDTYYNKAGSLISGSSLSSDYNLYALGLAVSLALSQHLSAFWSGKNWNKLFSLCIPVVILSILLSGSRRGILMVGFILFIIFFNKKILSSKNQMDLVILLIIPLIVVSIISYYWIDIIVFLAESSLIDYSIERIFTLDEELTGENQRTTRFAWCLSHFSDYGGLQTIVGGGFGYLKDMGRVFSGEIEDNPHNFLYSALLYGGYIGFAGMLIFVLRMVSAAFTHHRWWYPAVLLIVAFGFTSSNSLYAFRVFPTLALIVSLSSSKTLLMYGDNPRQ